MRNAEKMYKSLSRQHEINKSEFAEKQWQLGNRENAVKILEQIWKTGDKSCWGQLTGYFCKMGNYTRALQIVETMMQQKKPSTTLIPEYYRLRALIAANAPPEICGTIKTAANTGGEAVKDKPRHQIKRQSGTMFENFYNKNIDEDYFERLTAWCMEWNPGGECRSMIRRQRCDDQKLGEWALADTVQPDGVMIKVYEDMHRTWRSEALWESAPLFGGDDSMALAAMLKLVGNNGEGFNVLGNEDANRIEHEKFSMIRAYLAIAKNPDVKFVPVEKKYAPYNPDDNVRGYGNKVYGEEREINKDEAACDSGRKFMEMELKRIIRKRRDDFGKINLADMVCIDIMARLGNSAAEDLLSEINSVQLPSSVDGLRKLRAANYNTDALLALRVYRGDRGACELTLKGLREDKACIGFRDAMADVYYLMGKAGKKEIIAAMLKITEYKDKESIAALRWSNPELLKSLLLEHPELFELELYFYLLDGLNDPDFRDCMFNRQALLTLCSEYWIKYVLWLGKPLPEFYREQTLNYKRSE